MEESAVTYTIDPNNLPAELFAMTRERVRSGQGPVRLTPTEVLYVSGAPWAVMGKLKSGGPEHLYSAMDLYEHLAEAQRVGIERSAWRRSGIGWSLEKLAKAIMACRFAEGPAK